MPDWLTHVLFAWALWNILSLSVFHTPVGALITSGIISMALFRERIKQAHIFIALGTGSQTVLLFRDERMRSHTDEPDQPMI
jgi:hypothetical protein